MWFLLLIPYAIVAAIIFGVYSNFHPSYDEKGVPSDTKALVIGAFWPLLVPFYGLYHIASTAFHATEKARGKWNAPGRLVTLRGVTPPEAAPQPIIAPPPPALGDKLFDDAEYLVDDHEEPF